MNYIRKKCLHWSQKTFDELLYELTGFENDIINDVADIFKRLNIHDKKVNGFASENLPKTQEEHTGVRIRYSDIFHRVYQNSKFSPVLYLTELVKSYCEQKGKNEGIEGFLARGLRTFTSLIRENDFADKLKNLLLPKDKDIEISANPDQDAKDHTDVLLKYQKNIIVFGYFNYQRGGYLMILNV
jgi:hypothetical protein